MVKVGMGQEQNVNILRANGKRIPVPFEVRPLLVEAAIDKEAKPTGLQIIARSGDLLGRPKKPDLHQAQLNWFS
jgi:hypothetical protein